MWQCVGDKCDLTGHVVAPFCCLKLPNNLSSYPLLLTYSFSPLFLLAAYYYLFCFTLFLHIAQLPNLLSLPGSTAYPNAPWVKACGLNSLSFFDQLLPVVLYLLRVSHSTQLPKLCKSQVVETSYEVILMHQHHIQCLIFLFFTVQGMSLNHLMLAAITQKFYAG